KALLDATEGLKQTAPELIDSLHQAVEPMRTLAERRNELTSLIAGGVHTFGVAGRSFDNHADQLIGITSEVTPAIGTFANNSGKFVPIFQSARQFSEKWFANPWMSDRDTVNLRVNLSLTPGSTYTR
ncbi:MCE family protein, partial [Mycobacteroides abscessus subsp. bolletii]|nr:MCE family protein [Mycobacteroides abscessus subsp. bolletii]